MRHLIRNKLGRAFLLLLTVVIFEGCQSSRVDISKYDSGLAIDWNTLVMEFAIAEDGLLTLKGLRTESMMHLAVHNVLNAIQPVYVKFNTKINAPGADPIAAAAQAAFEIVLSQYPHNKVALDERLDSWLKQVKEGNAKEKGISLGKDVARDILQQRAEDAWNGEAEYTWHPMAPGVYAEFHEHSGTPEGFVFGAGWAAAKPFMLDSQSQFRSPPPPAIMSKAYTDAFNEVKEVGRYASASRTDDQSHFAMWWKDFVENSHNRLARDLVKKESLNLWQSTRLFALMNMAIYDAYVSVFENKFYYNHWRPFTAIRWAENDDNPDTEADTLWNNLHRHTYAFPSYPSAHGTASAAAMTVLAETLGTGDTYHFEMTTEEVDKAGPFSGKVAMQPATRSFDSFSEAAMEAALSRLYLGIHFRYDSEAGYQLGKQIGDYAVANFLGPTADNQ